MRIRRPRCLVEHCRRPSRHGKAYELARHLHGIVRDKCLDSIAIQGAQVSIVLECRFAQVGIDNSLLHHVHETIVVTVNVTPALGEQEGGKSHLEPHLYFAQGAACLCARPVASLGHQDMCCAEHLSPDKLDVLRVENDRWGFPAEQ